MPVAGGVAARMPGVPDTLQAMVPGFPDSMPSSCGAAWHCDSALDKMRAMGLALSKAKDRHFDCTALVKKLRAMVHATEDQVRLKAPCHRRSGDAPGPMPHVLHARCRPRPGASVGLRWPVVVWQPWGSLPPRAVRVCSAVGWQNAVLRRQGLFLSQVAARTVPKGLFCLHMRLTAEYWARLPDLSLPGGAQEQERVQRLQDKSLYHYALFSDNVLACAVVVNSTISNCKVKPLSTSLAPPPLSSPRAHSPVLPYTGKCTPIQVHFRKRSWVPRLLEPQ